MVTRIRILFHNDTKLRLTSERTIKLIVRCPQYTLHYDVIVPNDAKDVRDDDKLNATTTTRGRRASMPRYSGHLSTTYRLTHQRFQATPEIFVGAA